MFTEPDQTTYTIYSKSGCTFCVKAKNMLKADNINPIVIDCDDYLYEDKEAFLEFIEKKTNGIKYKTFPMIFYKGKFIGGYNETKEHHEKEKAFSALDIDHR